MIRVAVVRFSKTSKKYRYIIPDGISVDTGQYVIVPDKISDQRYKTAQCIATECYGKCPDTIYEYIVDVVDSTGYEKRKKRKERAQELDGILEQLRRRAIDYHGSFTIELSVDNLDGYTFTMTLQEPIGDGMEIDIMNEDSTLAEAVTKGIRTFYTL